MLIYNAMRKSIVDIRIAECKISFLRLREV